MNTVDHRTRFDGDVVELDPATFVDEQLAQLLDEHGVDAGRAAARLRLVSADPGGRRRAASPSPSRTTGARRGTGTQAVPWSSRWIRAPSPTSCRTSSRRSALQMTGRVTIRSRRVDDFVDWEPVLRCVLDGRPVYEPGTIDLRATGPANRSTCAGPSPSTTRPTRSATSWPRPASCISTGVFTDDEMAAVSAELDGPSPAPNGTTARRGGRAPRPGEWYPSRILGFNQKSPTLRSLLHDDRFLALGTFTDDDYVPTGPRRRRRRRGAAQEGRCGRGHLRCQLAQGLLDGRPQPTLLRAHRRHLGDRRRTARTVSWASSPGRIAPTSCRSASTGSTCPACRCRRAPATSPSTARARCT